MSLTEVQLFKLWGLGHLISIAYTIKRKQLCMHHFVLEAVYFHVEHLFIAHYFNAISFCNLIDYIKELVMYYTTTSHAYAVCWNGQSMKMVNVHTA